MTDNINKPTTTQAGTESENKHIYGRPALAWTSLLLAVAAWASLFWFNGYFALGLAVASAVCGFAGMPRRSAAVKRLAITAVIAATVLIVVVSAYLVVIKIGLS